MSKNNSPKTTVESEMIKALAIVDAVQSGHVKIVYPPFTGPVRKKSKVVASFCLNCGQVVQGNKGVFVCPLCGKDMDGVE